MQSKGWLFAVMLLPAVVIGCGAEAPAASSSPPVTITQSYPTGHAVVAVTDDVKLLEAKDHLEYLVNKHREQLGLNGFVIDLSAESLALGQAIHMVQCAFFGHLNPENESIEDRAASADITFIAIGENLASGQLSAEEVLLDWLSSPLHRANLESTTFTAFGAAYYEGQWVLTLLTPLPAQ